MIAYSGLMGKDYQVQVVLDVLPINRLVLFFISIKLLFFIID